MVKVCLSMTTGGRDWFRMAPIGLAVTHAVGEVRRERTDDEIESLVREVHDLGTILRQRKRIGASVDPFRRIVNQGGKPGGAPGTGIVIDALMSSGVTPGP